MYVGLDNVFDRPPISGCRLKIDIDIALGIDNGRDALRSNHVGRVSQATQIESLNFYRFHAFSPSPSIEAAPQHADKAGRTSSRPDTSALPVHPKPMAR